MTHQRLHVAAVLSLLAAVGGPAWAAPDAGRPNVIFILADDQGWGDAGFAGHPYLRTPHLDRLAAEGTWFRQFYVAAPVCSPSRAAFMTGRHPARFGIHGHFADAAANRRRGMPDWLDPGVTTLPGLLSAAGYATAHFGKWHLGAGPGAPTPADYGLAVSKTVNSSGEQLGDEAREPFFRARSTGLIVDETIRFIASHRDEPFYVNVWTLLPHARLEPTPEQLEAWADLDPVADRPAFEPWCDAYLAEAADLRSQLQVYAASIADLDAEIGRLLAALDDLGLADRTIVVFSSDNGPEDYRIANAANAGVGSPGCLRARKRSLYEGGVRTLGLVRWPGRVPAGRTDDASVVSGLDLLPTIATLAGVPLPEGLPLDGEDVSRLWLGDASHPRSTPLHWEWLFDVRGADDGYRPPRLAVRAGRWKLLVNHDGSGPQLYDIPADPAERHDLAASHPEIVQRLVAEATAWAAKLPPAAARTTGVAGAPVTP